jgi:hypothetical protein
LEVDAFSLSINSIKRAMSRLDYCQLLHRTRNSSPALTEEKFMLKALFSAVVVASFASLSAAHAQSPSGPSVKAVTAEKSTRAKLQPGTETVKVRAVYSPDVRPNPSTEDHDSSESGWRSYGMLLATLVLMGVIAVRRYQAGRS